MRGWRRVARGWRLGQRSAAGAVRGGSGDADSSAGSALLAGLWLERLLEVPRYGELVQFRSSSFGLRRCQVHRDLAASVCP